MLIAKTPYRKALPKTLNTHQVLGVARMMHASLSDQVLPLVGSMPKYAVFIGALDACDKGVQQLALAIARSKRKHPNDMRAIGSEDKALPEQDISTRKRVLYEARRKQYRFFKQRVSWERSVLLDMDEKTALTSDFFKRLTTLAEALNLQMAGFDKFSYMESQEEFSKLFERIESGPDAAELKQIVEEIGLSAIYQKARRLHEQLRTLINEQTQINARRKEARKVKGSDRELRNIVRHLLSLLHMDVQNGDDTLRELLADVDKLIDKEAATAAGRVTRKANRKLKSEEKIEEVNVKEREGRGETLEAREDGNAYDVDVEVADADSLKVLKQRMTYRFKDRLSLGCPYEPASDVASPPLSTERQDE